VGIFFSIEFGIWSGLGVLFFERFFTHKSYVSRVKSVDIVEFTSPRLSRMNPLKSCQRYCLT
jgi:hypothetical protein